MLISKIKIIIASENWFNYVLTFFKKKNARKIWISRTTLNGEKGENDLRKPRQYFSRNTST